MDDRKRITNCIRDPSPCRDCTERFTACSDNCPKDERGEYGHKAWTDERKRVKKAKQEYLDRTNVRKKHYFGGNSYGQE